jgi:hypothetical protein
MRAVIPLSRMQLGFLSHWGTRVVLSLELGYTRCVPSLLHVVVLSLSHWGTRDVFPLYLSQEEAWGVATAGGGVGCSNRRRRVFPQKSKRWRGEH